MARTSVTIDASGKAGGLDWAAYLTEAFSGEGAYKFYGGTQDIAYGRPFFMNGDQMSYAFGEAGATVVLEGSKLAYDFMHYGASAGHGLSGQLDGFTLGTWTDETTATQGNGAAGLIQGLNTDVVITGLGIDIAPRTGNVEANSLMPLFNGFNAGESAALTNLLANYKQNFVGSAEADTFTGGDYADVLRGYGGHDVLTGGAGNDRLHGASGRDTLSGGEGNDILHGGAHRDLLQGGEGNDRLYGGSYNDTLEGGAGDDRLNGGTGKDVLTGGEGADTFIFSTLNTRAQSDRITDFSQAEGDQIQFSGLGDFAFVGTDAFSQTAGELRFAAEGDNTRIQADTDGDGKADLSILLTGSHVLTAEDFIF